MDVSVSFSCDSTLVSHRASRDLFVEGPARDTRTLRTGVQELDNSTRGVREEGSVIEDFREQEVLRRSIDPLP